MNGVRNQTLIHMSTTNVSAKGDVEGCMNFPLQFPRRSTLQNSSDSVTTKRSGSGICVNSANQHKSRCCHDS
jgi:hypothetical protein